MKMNPFDNLSNAEIKIIETGEIVKAIISPMTYKYKMETYGGDVLGNDCMSTEKFLDEGTLFELDDKIYRIEKSFKYRSKYPYMNRCKSCIVDNSKRRK
jgi:hypothetical protein